MSNRVQLHYKKLTVLLILLIDKGFTDEEIDELLESVAEIHGLLSSLSTTPLPKTVKLLREKLASPKCPVDLEERFNFSVLGATL